MEHRITGDFVFNYIHNYEAGLPKHYASDLDLVLLERKPEPHIPAFLEMKRKGEPVKFTQAILFEYLKDIAPVFIIRSKNNLVELPSEEHLFDVELFVETKELLDEPPTMITETVEEDLHWGGYVENDSWTEFRCSEKDGLIGWEDNLRRGFLDYVDRDVSGGPFADYWDKK